MDCIDIAVGFTRELSDDDGMDCRFSDWEEEEGEEEIYEIRSIFTPSMAVLPSVVTLITYEKQHANIDLPSVINTKCGWGEDTDEVQLIKLVNFMRAFVRDNSDTMELPALVAALQDALHADYFLRDEFMRPTLSDDPLLFLLPEYVQSAVYTGDSGALPRSGAGEEADAVGYRSPQVEIAALRKRLKDCELLIQTLAADDDVVEAAGCGDSDRKTSMGADSGYFGSYSHLDIHEVMLNDRHRTNAYAAAISENREFIEGKIVLDVGCGSGILSMLAARAGAKLVIGIDVSDILEKTRVVIERNGLQSVITLIHGKIEECMHKILMHLPKDGKVDCIVSEWMGYGLYYENMLASVIFARDKFLRQGGLMLPSRAQIFLEAMSTQDDAEDRVTQWNDMYGFDMQDLSELFIRDAQVQLVTSSSSIITERLLVHDLDLYVARDADLDFSVNFELKVAIKSQFKAFVITFDTPFEKYKSNEVASIVLTTSVQSEPTHWKHTVLWLSQSSRMEVKQGDCIKGELVYRRSEDHRRDYSIALIWGCNELSHPLVDSKSQTFYLSS